MNGSHFVSRLTVCQAMANLDFLHEFCSHFSFIQGTARCLICSFIVASQSCNRSRLKFIQLSHRQLWIIFSQHSLLATRWSCVSSRCVYTSKTSAALAAQLKKPWIVELLPKDPSYLVVTLTSRAEIEQLTCKVMRECLKLKLAPSLSGETLKLSAGWPKCFSCNECTLFCTFVSNNLLFLCFRATENGSAWRNVRNSTSGGYQSLYHVFKKDAVKNSRRNKQKPRRYSRIHPKWCQGWVGLETGS